MKETPICVAVCTTLYDEICRGCGRTADEVSQWVTLTPQQKAEIRERVAKQGYPRRKSAVRKEEL